MSPEALISSSCDGGAEDPQWVQQTTPQPLEHPPRQLAFAKLAASDPKAAQLLEKHLDFQDSTRWHQETVNLLEAQLQDAETKRSTIKLSNNKTLVVREVFNKCVRWVNSMVSIGDVVVQYDPAHIALPWAAFRFILKSAVYYTETDSKAWDGIENICRDLAWAGLQEALYLNRATKADQALLDAFVEFYVSLYSAICKYLEWFHAKKIKRVLQSPFRPEIGHHIDQINDHKQRIERFSLQVDREMQDVQGSQIRKIRDQLKLLNVCTNHAQAFNRAVYDWVEEQERIEICKWMSEIPYEDHFKVMSDGVLPGTGKWFLDTSDFRRWRDSSTSEALRLHGKPGSGKSILFTIVLEKLQNYCRENGLSPPVYFYCLSGEPSRSQPLQILRCILRQLAVNIEGSDIHQAIIRRYKQSKGAVQEREMIGLLSDCIRDRGRTYILIDALDETDIFSRDQITALAQLLNKSTAGAVKIFVTSRIDQYQGSFLDHPEVTITPESNADDIRLWIDDELERMKAGRWLLKGHASTELLKLIKEKLSKKADGMFQWVKIKLQNLKIMKSEDAIKKSLEAATPGLEKVYLETFKHEVEHLETYDPDGKEIVLHTFQLLLASQIEIKARDFCAIVSHPTDANDEKGSFEELAGYCFSFVQYDKYADVFKFSHLSIREFLDLPALQKGFPDFQTPLLHSSVATMCLDVVFDKCQKNTKSTVYAIIFWAYHAQQAREARRTCESLRSRLCKILQRSDSLFKRWRLSLADLQRRNAHPFFGWIGSLMSRDHACWPLVENWEQVSPLVVAVMWDLHDLLPDLLEAQTDRLFMKASICYAPSNFFNPMPTHDIRRRGLLECAAERGNIQVLEFLLQCAGVSVDSSPCSPGSALFLASKNKHWAVVRLLLSHGAVNYTHENFVHALVENLRFGTDIQNLETMLDSWGDIDGRQAPHYLTPALVIAAQEHNLPAVELLINKKATINVTDSSGRSALWYACSGCRPQNAIVQALLDAHADPDLKDNKGKTALMQAAKSGCHDTVRLLLDARACLEIRDDSGRGALYYCLAKNSILGIANPKYKKLDIAYQLLEHVSNIGLGDKPEVIQQLRNDTIRSGKGCQKVTTEILSISGSNIFTFDQESLGKGLENAVNFGGSEDVGFLLEHRPPLTNSLLAKAMRRDEGHIRQEMSLQLLRAGVKADSRDFEGITPLQMACSKFADKADIELLLQYGASVSLSCEPDENPLLLALHHGHIGSVEALLKQLMHEACNDLTYKQKPYTLSLISAGLVQAARANQVDVMRLLLDQRADVNWVDSRLSTFTGKGVRRTVSGAGYNPLVSRAPNVLRIRGEYGTALAAAASGGHLPAMMLLLQHKANVNVIGGKYGTALAAAASHLELKAIEILLQHKADVNAAHHKYGTALLQSVAALDRHCHVEQLVAIVDRLCRARTNVSLETGGLNVLDHAQRHLQNVQILSEQNDEDRKLLAPSLVQFHYTDPNTETALEEIIAILVSHGAKHSAEYLRRQRTKNSELSPAERLDVLQGFWALTSFEDDGRRSNSNMT